MTIGARLARWRVPLGFVCGALAFVFARPTPEALAIGAAVAVLGEALRVWAAGHIEKDREVTRSGPYRYLRHPLYTGSAILALGFAVAARSVAVWAIAAVYLGGTYIAAVRKEEASLDARFAGEYTAYRAGAAAPVARSFSFARAWRNREHRAVLGVALAFLVLAAELWARRG